jgi:hypothetical protein
MTITVIGNSVISEGMSDIRPSLLWMPEDLKERYKEADDGDRASEVLLMNQTLEIESRPVGRRTVLFS